MIFSDHFETAPFLSMFPAVHIYRKEKNKKSFLFRLENGIINWFGMLYFQGPEGFQKGQKNSEKQSYA